MQKWFSKSITDMKDIKQGDIKHSEWKQIGEVMFGLKSKWFNGSQSSCTCL